MQYDFRHPNRLESAHPPQTEHIAQHVVSGTSRSRPHLELDAASNGRPNEEDAQLGSDSAVDFCGKHREHVVHQSVDIVGEPCVLSRRWSYRDSGSGRIRSRGWWSCSP